MKAIYDTTYIFSAELAKLGPGLNKERTKQLEIELQNIGAAYKQVKGVFDNKPEASFVVQGIAEKTVRYFLGVFDQVCALKLNCDRTAEFISPDGQVTPAGKFVAVTEDVARTKSVYTFDPVTKQFFILEE